MATLRLSTRSSALPTGHFPEYHPSGYSPLVLSCHAPREEEPSLTDGPFNALASCLFEGLRVRKGGVVGTPSALEASDSQEDLVVRRSEPSEVLRTEGPRHTPVHHILNFLGLQHTDFQKVERSSYHTTPDRTV